MVRPLAISFLLAFGITGTSAYAETQVCFTPGQNCTGEIVATIGSARKEVMVEAFNFTSRPIIKALAQAEHRGVRIDLILAPKHEKPSYAARQLIAAGIRPLVDDKVKTAHNKVMIIDGTTVITGSFNFTTSAQEANAENLLIIRDPAIAGQYMANFRRRAAASRPFAVRPTARGGDNDDE